MNWSQTQQLERLLGCHGFTDAEIIVQVSPVNVCENPYDVLLSVSQAYVKTTYIR